MTKKTPNDAELKNFVYVCLRHGLKHNPELDIFLTKFPDRIIMRDNQNNPLMEINMDTPSGLTES